MIRTRTRRKLLKKIETATTRGRTLVLKTLLRQSLGIMSSSRDVGKPARKKRTVVCKACGKLLAFKMGLSSDPQRPKTSLTSLPSALTLPLSKLRTPLKSVFLAFKNGGRRRVDVPRHAVKRQNPGACLTINQITKIVQISDSF